MDRTIPTPFSVTSKYWYFLLMDLRLIHSCAMHLSAALRRSSRVYCLPVDSNISCAMISSILKNTVLRDAPFFSMNATMWLRIAKTDSSTYIFPVIRLFEPCNDPFEMGFDDYWSYPV